MITKIFVDLDDVLAECTIPALRSVGCDVSLDTYKPEWGWNIHEAANSLLGEPDHFSRYGFWSRFGQRFWATLPVQEGAQELLHTCEELVGRDRVCILTTPTPFPGCAEGKLAWIGKYFPGYSDQLLIGGPKYLCASPESLLIDDRQDNITQFIAAGGPGIIYPRPWNPKHGLAHVAHLTVMQALDLFRDVFRVTSRPAQPRS